MAFVLIVPNDPVEIVAFLSEHTEVSVVEAEHGVAVEPDHVYVIPPDRSFHVLDGRMQLVRVELHEMSRRCKDGSTGDAPLSISAALDESGRVTNPAALAPDIGRLKAAEEKLLEADRRKEEFLSMLAHELRNPLAAMRNGISLLRMRPQGVEATKGPTGEWVAEMLDRQTEQLRRLVDDLLEAERISQGKIVLRKQVCSISAAIRAAADGIRETNASRRQKLVVQLPDVPIHADVDPGRLAQILGNLLDNAVKNTQPGGRVELSAGLADGDVVIRCRDTGRGMPPEVLERVFEPFQQGRTAVDGLGIGLAVVRKLTELHGGSVSASSEGLRKGSELVVRLPAAPPPLGAPSSPPEGLRSEPPRRAGLKVHLDSFEDGARFHAALRILLVEDHEQLGKVTAELLSKRGHRVDWARTGEEAIRMASTRPPDLVICDLNLPDISGVEVVRRLRQDQGRSAVFVALSAHDPETLERQAGSAFDLHLPKPLDWNALSAALTKLNRRPSPPSARNTGTTS